MTPRDRLARPARPSVVVFIDGQRARLIPSLAGGHGEEIVLEHDVEGRHRQGGWALLNQSRYRRHIEAHRAQHFDAVAKALADLVQRDGIERIVLAGEKRAGAAFGRHLPAALTALVVGRMAGAWHENAATLLTRAVPLLNGGARHTTSAVRGA